MRTLLMSGNLIVFSREVGTRRRRPWDDGHIKISMDAPTIVNTIRTAGLLSMKIAPHVACEPEHLLWIRYRVHAQNSSLFVVTQNTQKFLKQILPLAREST